MVEELNLKCPKCEEPLEFVGRTGKLLHYRCSGEECFVEIDVYEKIKSNSPKIKDGKIIEGEY